MDIKKYTEEIIEKLDNLSDKEFNKLIEESSHKFHGNLMGLTYIIYYCKDCEVDFAINSRKDAYYCPSCKSENIISGDVQDFC